MGRKGRGSVFHLCFHRSFYLGKPHVWRESCKHREWGDRGASRACSRLPPADPRLPGPADGLPLRWTLAAGQCLNWMAQAGQCFSPARVAPSRLLRRHPGSENTPRVRRWCPRQGTGAGDMAGIFRRPGFGARLLGSQKDWAQLRKCLVAQEGSQCLRTDIIGRQIKK